MRRPVGQRAAEHRRRRRLDRRLQLAQVARRREVLVLVGDLDDLDAVARGEAGDRPARRARSGADAPAVTPTMRAVASSSSGSSSAVLTRATCGAAGLAGQLLEGPGVRRVGRADDDDGVAALGQLHQRRLPVRRGEAQVAAARRPHVGEALAARRRRRRPSRGATAWSGRAGRRARRTSGSAATSATRLDPADRRRARRPSCRRPPRGPRGRRRRCGSPCRRAPGPRGGPW